MILTVTELMSREGITFLNIIAVFYSELMTYQIKAF